MAHRIPVEIAREKLASLCRRHRIVRLAIFGSALRDDFGPSSDIDILVEFASGHIVTFFTLADVQYDLEALLGRTVDLHLWRTLSPYLRDRILAEAEDLYVGA
jgi:uncharacterized protein